MLFQSWQVETANVLPPSVTRLNFGQIKFILLYLVLLLFCSECSYLTIFFELFKMSSATFVIVHILQQYSEIVWTFSKIRD